MFPSLLRSVRTLRSVRSSSSSSSSSSSTSTAPTSKSRRNLAIAATAVALPCAYAYQTYRSSPGLRREVAFWSFALRPTLHYLYVAKTYPADSPHTRRRLAHLHAQYAPVALAAIQELGGLYVKFGQYASVRPEFVPAPYRAAFKTLQSEVPPPPTDPLPIIARELGRAAEAVFERFDAVPCGSASIGQAHTAKLTQAFGGDEVVVKVQYPDAAELMEADLKCFGALVEMARPAALPFFKRLSSQLRRELDYVAEREAMTGVGAAVRSGYADARKVCVPVARADLSTARVLTMSYLPGPKLQDAAEARLQALGLGMHGARRLIRTTHLRGEKRAVEEDEVVDNDGERKRRVAGAEDAHTLPRSVAATAVGRTLGWVASSGPGLSLLRWFLWLRLVCLDVVADVVASFGTGAVANTSTGTGTGTGTDTSTGQWAAWAAARREQRTRTAALRQTQSWLDTLFDVHGFEIFDASCPCFNADPHPGNVILCPDGRIGLIDYGQCCALPDDIRAGVARLIVAVADRADDEAVANAFREAGIETEADDTAYVAQFGRLLFDRIEPRFLRREFHRDLHRRDKVVHMPTELYLLYRVAAMLRGLGFVVQRNVSVSEMWRPHAARYLAEHGLPLRSQMEEQTQAQGRRQRQRRRQRQSTASSTTATAGVRGEEEEEEGGAAVAVMEELGKELGNLEQVAPSQPRQNTTPWLLRKLGFGGNDSGGGCPFDVFSSSSGGSSSREEEPSSEATTTAAVLAVAAPAEPEQQKREKPTSLPFGHPKLGNGGKCPYDFWSKREPEKKEEPAAAAAV